MSTVNVTVLPPGGSDRATKGRSQAMRTAFGRAFRTWITWPLVLLLLVLAPPSAHAEATVQDVRIAPTADGARVVIELSRDVSFRHIVLEQPPRLVIDLPEIAWLVPEAIGDQPTGFVRGFRFGRFRPGVSRLVLDVAEPFEVRDVFKLRPDGTRGHRIVTELSATADGEWPAGGALQPAGFVGSGGAEDGFLRQQAALPVPLRKAPRETEPPASDGKRVIVIDPGHGGIDPGAIGTNGTYEKNIVLEIARELRRQLQGSGRYEVVLTREGDEFVRLRERLEIAREHRGDLFMSLHADSLVKAREVRGAAVYTLSERASNDEAARLASAENRADILGGVDLSEQEDIVTRILIDLAQRDANNKSIRMAELLVEELSDATTMLRHRRQQAGFVVLKSPDMPSVLVELGYLSNTTDERLLNDPEHRAELSEAIVRAVERYFGAEAF